MSRGPGPTVSVIVLHYDQPGALRRTLDALAAQTLGPEHCEVIVVDDGSPTAPTVPTGVRRLIQARDGARRSAARNAGVAAARGGILAFLDADTAPEPGYLDALTAPIRADPATVTVGRRRHADLSRLAPGADLTREAPRHAFPEPEWLADGYAESADLTHPDPRSFRFIISAVLAVDAAFFAAVGGFDETLREYGGEDWEWAHRAWLAGARFRHVPTAVAWHDGPDWAGRDQADAAARRRAREAKNAEAIRLASRLNVAGHRPRGIRIGRPDIHIVIAPETALAPAFLTADSLLVALPHAVISGPPALADAFPADPRLRPRSGERQGPDDPDPPAALRLEVHAPLRVSGPGLSELCARMLTEDTPALHLDDGAGPLMTLTSARELARRRRDPDRAEATVPSLEPPAGVQRLPDPPDVEAHLGGWPPRQV